MREPVEMEHLTGTNQTDHGPGPAGPVVPGRPKKTDPAVPHPGPKQPAGTGLTPYIAPPGLTYRPDVPEASRWPPLAAVYTSALGGE